MDSEGNLKTANPELGTDNGNWSLAAAFSVVVSEGVGEDFVIMEPIKLELAVVNEIKEEAGGEAGIKVHVFGVGGKLSSATSTEQTSRITISISPKITEEQLGDKTFMITKMGLKKG